MRTQLFFLHTHVCSPCATCGVNGRGKILLAKRPDSAAPIARRPSGSGARAGRTLCFRALACAPKRSSGVRWRHLKHSRAAAERMFRRCKARTSGVSRPTRSVSGRRMRRRLLQVERDVAGRAAAQGWKMRSRGRREGDRLRKSVRGGLGAGRQRNRAIPIVAQIARRRLSPGTCVALTSSSQAACRKKSKPRRR